MNDVAGVQPCVNSQSASANKKFAITVKVEPYGRTVALEGRAAWMMSRLVEAGKRGVTTLELPAGIRVSHCIYLLRRAGFVISSPREAHGGVFAGVHSRYRLETEVSILSEGLAA